MRKKSITSWITVADGAKARIYSSTGPTLNLSLVEELDSARARQRSGDLMSDRQGRTQNRNGPGGAAMENPSDPQSIEKHKFARDLVDYLEAAAYAGNFDELALVAAPRTLGEIRKLMPDILAAKVSHELDKDLTNVPGPELEAHLAPLEIGKPKLS